LECAVGGSWDQRACPEKDALIERLTSPEHRILDIACGNGGIPKHLMNRGYRNLEGPEISEYAVNRLRGERLTMHRGRLPRLPLPEPAMMSS